jgi:hypothetical protein
MYDEPGIEPKELIDPRSPRRLRKGSLVRAVGAAVPTLAAAFWLSALLDVGPVVGHEEVGFLVAIAAFALWFATLGRSVALR